MLYNLLDCTKHYRLIWKAVGRYCLNAGNVDPFSAGDRLYTSEPDICRRQILTYKDDRRAERIKIYLMAVDTKHRYSNESERAE